MKQVNQANFEDEVLKSEKPVVVDFWAEWCGPCRMLGPIFEKVGAEMADSATFVKLNVDENQDLTQQFDVRGIPAMLIFKDGKEVERLTGALDESTLKAKVQAAIA
jgi:thioredoxin 1